MSLSKWTLYRDSIQGLWEIIPVNVFQRLMAKRQVLESDYWSHWRKRETIDIVQVPLRSVSPRVNDPW